MKNLLALLSILAMFSFSSCIIDVDDDWNGPPCEINYTGTVCFVNYTGRDVFIQAGNLNIDVWAYSDVCVEVSGGYYQFFAQSGVIQWDGGFEVFPCEESRVFLDY